MANDLSDMPLTTPASTDDPAGGAAAIRDVKARVVNTMDVEHALTGEHQIHIGPIPPTPVVGQVEGQLWYDTSVNPDALVAELEKTDHMGAIGRIRFDKKSHQVIYGLDPKETAMTCVFQWQKPGKRVVVYPETIAEAKIQLPPGLKPTK